MVCFIVVLVRGSIASIMEQLSQILQAYEPTIATVASTITMAQFLAPAAICLEIYHAKSTKGKVALPFAGGIILGCMMMIYANVLNDPTMIRVNYVGITLNTIYAIFYYLYSENKNELLRPLSYGILLLVGVYAYAKLENQELVEHRLGIFVTMSMFTFIASPLFDIRDIIRENNAEILPIPIISCGAVVSTLWLVYGITVLNYFMVIQNAIGLFLSFIQIMVWIFYRGGVEGNRVKAS